MFFFFFPVVGSPEYRKMLPESKGSLSKDLVKDGKAWCTVFHGVARVGHNLVMEQDYIYKYLYILTHTYIYTD